MNKEQLEATIHQAQQGRARYSIGGSLRRESSEAAETRKANKSAAFLVRCEGSLQVAR
jgi:hypothetical protein